MTVMGEEEEVSLCNESILVYIENVGIIVEVLGSFIGVVILVLIILAAVYIIYRRNHQEN